MKSTYVKILSCILFFSSIKLFQPFNQTIPIEAQQCQQKSREKNPSILTSLTTNRYDESMALSCVCSFFLLGLLIYLSLFKLTQVSVRRTTNTFQIHVLLNQSYSLRSTCLFENCNNTKGLTMIPVQCHRDIEFSQSSTATSAISSCLGVLCLSQRGTQI